jgi:hypothetical protein
MTMGILPFVLPPTQAAPPRLPDIVPVAVLAWSGPSRAGTVVTVAPGAVCDVAGDPLPHSVGCVWTCGVDSGDLGSFFYPFLVLGRNSGRRSSMAASATPFRVVGSTK